MYSEPESSYVKFLFMPIQLLKAVVLAGWISNQKARETSTSVAAVSRDCIHLYEPQTYTAHIHHEHTDLSSPLISKRPAFFVAVFAACTSISTEVL